MIPLSDRITVDKVQQFSKVATSDVENRAKQI
jgi:hypothetical protein